MTPSQSSMARLAASPDGLGLWHSWHLHIATFAPAALDSVVVEVLGGMADRLGLLEADGPPWFFLRYWQGGPHVRLRMAGLTRAQAGQIAAELADRLTPLDAAVPAAQRLDQDAYTRAVGPVAAAGEHGIPMDAGRLIAPGVWSAAYEPECDRYGGPRLMARSERLFVHSSRVCLRACLARAGTRHATASGLEAMAAACSVLDGHRAPLNPTDFLTRQRDAWLAWERSEAAATSAEQARGRLDDLARAQLAASDGLGPRLLDAVHRGDPRWAEWTDPLGAALHDWTTELGPGRAAGVLASHLHMTANRLGVGAGREAHLSALLLAALGTQRQRQRAGARRAANGSDSPP